MKRINLAKTIQLVARIWGILILAVVFIALFQSILTGRYLFADFRGISLFIGLILGLSIAFKWELVGGIIASLGILLSGFIHPLVIPPGILYIVHWFLKKKSLKTQ